MSEFAPAVGTATKIIKFISEQNREVGISEICRETGFNKNIVFRVLNSLEQEGWVYRLDQKFGLTLVPFAITSRSLSKINLNTISIPAVYDLWRTTNESTYFGVLSEDKVLYLQHLDGTKDIKVSGRVGGEYDLYCSAPGKVLLAHADKDFIDRYLQKTFIKRTAQTIIDSNELANELEQIRQNGYATDKEEFGKGIFCVAHPIYDYTGTVVAVIGCSMFILDSNYEENIAKILPAIRESAMKISVQLGYEIGL